MLTDYDFIEDHECDMYGLISDSEEETNDEIEEELYQEIHYSGRIKCTEKDSNVDDATAGHIDRPLNNDKIVDRSSLPKNGLFWILPLTVDDDGLQTNLVGAAITSKSVQDDASSAHEASSGRQWNIDPADVVNNVQNSEGRRRISFETKRYYTSKSSIRCFNCGNNGHLSRNCSSPRKVTVCFLCAGQGHTERKCPKQICEGCKKTGHPLRYCRERSWKTAHAVCKRCEVKGHNSEECPDIWRQFHATTEPGMIRRLTTKKKMGKIYCYNCAKMGHLGHECTGHRMHKSIPATPFICRYDNWDYVAKIWRKNQAAKNNDERQKQGHKRKYEDYNEHTSYTDERNTYKPVDTKKKNKQQKWEEKRKYGDHHEHIPYSHEKNTFKPVDTKKKNKQQKQGHKRKYEDYEDTLYTDERDTYKPMHTKKKNKQQKQGHKRKYEDYEHTLYTDERNTYKPMHTKKKNKQQKWGQKRKYEDHYEHTSYTHERNTFKPMPKKRKKGDSKWNGKVEYGKDHNSYMSKRGFFKGRKK
ncbi:zinc finger CCHC domain-containing protein 7-like [Ptychodera flava]|uniref:zinc finger CCHC domain-containing protein 7-like n=1 Tax=Ptychodera flava TaxID=63121 RepID=UPI003969CB9F